MGMEVKSECRKKSNIYLHVLTYGAASVAQKFCLTQKESWSNILFNRMNLGSYWQSLILYTFDSDIMYKRLLTRAGSSASRFPPGKSSTKAYAGYSPKYCQKVLTGGNSKRKPGGPCPKFHHQARRHQQKNTWRELLLLSRNW